MFGKLGSGASTIVREVLGPYGYTLRLLDRVWKVMVKGFHHCQGCFRVKV